MARNKNTGFTLIELLIVLVVVAVLASLAFPFYNKIIMQQEINNARHTLVHSLAKAKRMASAENTFIDVKLDNNTIELHSKATGTNEYHNFPKNVVFLSSQFFTFSANGVLVSPEGNSINSETQINFKHSQAASDEQQVNISPTGLIVALE